MNGRRADEAARRGVLASRSRNSLLRRSIARRGMTWSSGHPVLHGRLPPCAKALPSSNDPPLRHAPGAKGVALGWLAPRLRRLYMRLLPGCCTVPRWRCSAARCSGSRATSSGCSAPSPASCWWRRCCHRAVCGQPRAAARRRAWLPPHWPPGAPRDSRPVVFGVLLASPAPAGVDLDRADHRLRTGTGAQPGRVPARGGADRPGPPVRDLLALGGVPAAPVFASSVVAIPLLLDREVGVLAAVFTSWRGDGQPGWRWRCGRPDHGPHAGHEASVMLGLAIGALARARELARLPRPCRHLRPGRAALSEGQGASIVRHTAKTRSPGSASPWGDGHALPWCSSSCSSRASRRRASSAPSCRCSGWAWALIGFPRPGPDQVLPSGHRRMNTTAICATPGTTTRWLVTGTLFITIGVSIAPPMLAVSSRARAGGWPSSPITPPASVSGRCSSPSTCSFYALAWRAMGEPSRSRPLPR